MQFKFKNIKITVSFTFFALIILLVIFNKNDFLYFTCFFAIIHELGHLFTLNKFGVKICELKISLFGANIKTESFKRISIKKSKFFPPNLTFCINFHTKRKCFSYFAEFAEFNHKTRLKSL